jgi:hypothetical protein
MHPQMSPAKTECGKNKKNAFKLLQWSIDCDILNS